MLADRHPPHRCGASAAEAVTHGVHLGAAHSRANLETSKRGVAQHCLFTARRYQRLYASDRDLAAHRNALHPGHTGVTPCRNVLCGLGNGKYQLSVWNARVGGTSETVGRALEERELQTFNQ